MVQSASGGRFFYFIGNTVIHSCVKVELSYEIKTLLRGCAARGKENIALRNASARRISQARFFLCGCQNPVDKYIQYVKINHVHA